MNLVDQITSYSFSILDGIGFFLNIGNVLIPVGFIFGIFQYMRWKKESRRKETDLRKWAKELKKKHHK